MNPRVLRHRSSLSRSSSSLALTGIVVGLLGFAWTQAALGDDLERLRELEARVGGLLRGVPACVEPAEEETTLRLYAERLGGLEPSEIRRAANSERAVLADGRPSSVELVRWEVSGEAHYGQVRNYLSQLGRLDRLISLEDAAVEASAPGTVRYSLRLLYPCQDADADAPGPLDPDDAAEVGARRVEELELSRQLLTGLHALPKPGALIDALSNLEERLQDQAVAFNILIKAGDRVGFAGVLRGEAARGAIGPALDASGLSVVDTTFRPSMACQTFAIKTVMGVIDAREAASSDDGLFDAGAGESCAPISRQGEAVARRVETTGTTAADAGGLTLHLRDVEIGDLFSVLFHLTGIPGLGFVVGPEVHGRLSVDAEDVTLDELLAALDTAGIALGPGPLHRVSTSSPDPSSPAIPAADRYSEPALTVSFQDQELASILCLFGAVGERRVAV
ncbi:MAG: hypothetical protein KDD11_19090, partial [Acidobacteria bacterium]|nr:hypothetical protein [Acidobacteriota bacterium]